MTPNPFSALLRSRKFWIAIVDVFASTLLYFVTKYAVPSAAEDVKFLIAAYQPVMLLVIASIAVENVQNVKAKTSIAESVGWNTPSNLVDSLGNVVATVVNPVQLK